LAPSKDLIAGVHPVEEALSAGVPVSKILLAEGEHARLEAITRQAKARRIPVETRSRRDLDRLAGGLRHQGVMAEVEAYAYRPLEDLVAKAAGRPLAIADGVTDPQNIGAMLRAIDAAGGAGLVLGEHRSGGVTPGARKASAGASEHVGVARVTNISRAIETVQKAGGWVLALDSSGPTDLYEADLSGPLAFVVGSEGKGISRLARERADVLVRIPMAGGTPSLNVAQSLAVALFEWRRRQEDGGGPVRGGPA
jgi:23S rRNA (guanosine2251-2'-O)-methyltransferase